MENIKDKILGCLIGGAIGDALGYPVEFMQRSQIIDRYGPKGITRYELNDQGVAEISDDTQMTLYTAEGLIIDDIVGAYLEWLDTQNHYAEIPKESKCTLSQDPRMYALRAPGNTCLSALNAIRQGKEAHNNSKGCGGIMRVAPIALYNVAHSVDCIETARMACEAARLTHKHTYGWWSAGIFAYLLHRIIEDSLTKPEDIMTIAIDGLNVVTDLYPFEQEDYDEMLDKLRLVYEVYADGNGGYAEESTKIFGEGWTGDEALYISLFCAIANVDNFENSIVDAVNHSGDSDSTGAITGNIMGAMLGYKAIPEHYLKDLELRDVIEKMADRLMECKS